MGQRYRLYTLFKVTIFVLSIALIEWPSVRGEFNRHFRDGDVALSDSNSVKTMPSDTDDPKQMQQKLLKLQMDVLHEILNRKNMTRTVAMLLKKTNNLGTLFYQFQGLMTDVEGIKAMVTSLRQGVETLNQNVTSLAGSVGVTSGNSTLGPTTSLTLRRLEEELNKRQRRMIEALAKDMQKAFSEIHVNRKSHRYNSDVNDRLSSDISAIKRKVAELTSRVDATGGTLSDNTPCDHMTADVRRSREMDRCSYVKDLEKKIYGLEDRIKDQSSKIRSLSEDVERQKAGMTHARVQLSMMAGKLADEGALLRQCGEIARREAERKTMSFQDKLAELEDKLLKQSWKYEDLKRQRHQQLHGPAGHTNHHMKNEVMTLQRKVTNIDESLQSIVQFVKLANSTMAQHHKDNMQLRNSIKAVELGTRLDNLQGDSKRMLFLLHNLNNSRHMIKTDTSRDSQNAIKRITNEASSYDSSIRKLGMIVKNITDLVLRSSVQEGVVKDYVIEMKRKIDTLLHNLDLAEDPEVQSSAVSADQVTSHSSTTIRSSTTSSTSQLPSTTTTSTTTTTTSTSTTVPTTTTQTTTTISPITHHNGVIHLPVSGDSSHGYKPPFRIAPAEEPANMDKESGHSAMRPLPPPLSNEGETGRFRNCANCTVIGFSSPLLVLALRHRLTVTWMSDPMSSLPTVWLMMPRESGLINEMLEYSDQDMLESNSFTRPIKLPFRCGGTGHVVYNGSLYCNIHATNRIVKFDLRTGNVQKRRIKDAGKNMTFHYSSGADTDIDFAVDEKGLWVIYATEENEGNIVVGKIDTDTFTIKARWNTGYSKRSANNAFMICGKLHVTVLYPGLSMDVRYIFDTDAGWGYPMPQGELRFQEDEYYVAMLDYNPRDSKLYGWRLSADWDGHAVTYDVQFKN